MKAKKEQTTKPTIGSFAEKLEHALAGVGRAAGEAAGEMFEERQ